MKEILSFQLWLVWRYVRSGGRFVGLTTILSFTGMVIGVASLVLTMAAVSGFESTLRQAVIDVAGDIIVYKTSGRMEPPKELVAKIKKVVPDVVAYTPFAHTEGILASKGKTIGIALQGVDPENVQKVLNFKSRVIKGEFDLTNHDERPSVLLGKALANKLEISAGDIVTLVVPRPSKASPTSFSPKAEKVHVAGIVDLGKYEYDLRMVIGTARLVQDLTGVSDLFSGVKLKLRDSSDAQTAASKIAGSLGYAYLVKDWTEVNKNLFEAIRIERWVIFIVVSFLIITASFNICSSLFVAVLKRYGDLSILRTMGASQKFLVRLFSIQGMVVGVLGSLVGVALGLGLGFSLVHTELFKIPGEVYKLDHLPIEVRFFDVAAILAVSCLICFLSTLAPAVRGSRLNPVDGLRYE
ncbi:MAG: ABC transporter permease [Bdellovibrionia bacterium]